MRVLFIQGGSRIRETNNGTVYVDGNFNNNIWRRYRNYCDELVVILRKIDKKFDEKDLINKFNNVDTNLINLKTVEDIYSPKLNFISIKVRNKIKKVIEEEVKKSDKVIIRSIGNYYTNTALKYCKKYNKDYVIEVTGFGFEGIWYHGFLGKLLAVYREVKMKKELKIAPNALYVTESTLQARYKCLGNSIGCSDVEVKNNLYNRKFEDKETIIIGTLGFVNVKFKGYKDVLKAMYKIKKKNNGKLNIVYEIVGGGDRTYLNNVIKKYNIESNVKMLGEMPHDKVFEWLKQLDIYIHPSYTEGLCRSIIEAMSVGTPVIAANVGGNKELINKKWLFPKGNINSIIEKIERMTLNERTEQSKINFNKSKIFDSELLNKKRDKFYKEFISYKIVE